MAEFEATHDMDSFLVNPTIRKNSPYINLPTPNMSGDLIPIFLSQEVLTVKAGKQAVEPTGAIRRFAGQPIFTQGYASEEEEASPVEDNDFGFHSNSDIESSPSIRESASFESLLDQASGLQLFNSAQTVRFVSVGKPKVVSVVKPVEVSPLGSIRRSIHNGSIVSTGSKLQGDAPRSSYDSSLSPRSSSDRSPASSSIGEQPVRTRTLRRKFKLPPLQTAPSSASSRSTRTQTPLVEQRADFTKRLPASSTWPYHSPVSVSPSKQRAPKVAPAPKVSPSFRLKNFTRSRRSDSSASSSSEGFEGRMDWWSTTPPAFATTRNVTNKPIPKLVARGASERAPTIVLPPCPDDYDNDWDDGHRADWPLRNDSIPSDRDLAMSGTLKHIRRKSVSAAHVTTQA